MASPLTLALERTDSHPSLTHSTSSDDHLPTHRGLNGTGSEALLTPTCGHDADLSLTRSTSDLVSSPDADVSAFPLSPQDPRGGKKVSGDERGRRTENEARLWSSKSSSALRSKSKDTKGRGRSSTVSEQPPPLPPISIPSRSGTSPPQSKSAGPFSSFFKKLTGRSTSVPKKSGPSTSPKSVPPLPVLQAMQSHTSQIAPTAPISSHSRQRSRGSVSDQARSPVVQQSTSTSAPRPAHLRSPSNLSARSNRSQNATVMTSPAKQAAQPLSSSPTDAAPAPQANETPEDSRAESCENVFMAPTTDGEVLKKSPMKRNRASFTLASAAAPEPALAPPPEPEPEVEQLEEPEEMEEMEEVDSEAEDEFHDLPSRPPLEPILIPRSAATRTDPLSAGPMTANTTATSEGEALVTPSSPGTSPSKSPPRYDPIVDPPPQQGLARKESKWRKSLMGLGVAGKPQKQQPARVTRRISSREPPTSYDAYLTQQKRIASNRQSCQPTIHTAGSVAAETRGLSREEQDAAETFFLS